MGRALFSTMYTQPVSVRTQPDVPDHSDLPRCEKWSISNPFDPDSDEFAKSATREVFTDTEAWRIEQAAVRELLAVEAVRASIEGSSTSEASESDSGSPMAVGYDDPAELIANGFSDSEAAPASPLRVTRRSVGTLPPNFRRTVPITPIIIPNETSSPSPPSPATPSTPADTVYQHQVASVFTPHLYTWRPTPLAVPPSPLASLSNPAGPLTNPDARLSFVSLNVRPTIVRAQNAAV